MIAFMAGAVKRSNAARRAWGIPRAVFSERRCAGNNGNSNLQKHTTTTDNTAVGVL